MPQNPPIHDDPAYVALRSEVSQYTAEMSDALRSFLGDISMNGIPADITPDSIFAEAEAAHDARVKTLSGTVLRLSRPKAAAAKKKAAKKKAAKKKAAKKKAAKKKAAKVNGEIGKLARPKGRKA